MQTKHCDFCHAVQRAEAHICSRCGRTLPLRKSREATGGDLANPPSLPPASPHRAGHYAGLHPEDQPYQTNQIFAIPSWSEALVDPKTEIPLEHEPERIVLRRSGALEAKTDSLSSAPTRPTLSARSKQTSSPQTETSWPPPPKRSWFSEKAIPLLIACSGLFFLLASSVIAFGLMGNRPTLAQASVMVDSSVVHIGDTFKLTGSGFGANHPIRFSYDAREPILDDQNKPLSVSSDEMGRFSVSMLVPTSWQIGPHTLHSQDTIANIETSTTITLEPTSSSDWQLSNTTLFFDTTAAGSDEQRITLINNAKRALTWQVSSKPSWLSVIPDHGTIPKHTQEVRVQVQPGNLAPGTYPDKVTFSATQATALTLTISMQVRPGPAKPQASVDAQVTVTPQAVTPGNLNVTPTSLAFSTQAGQPASSQPLTLQNSGGMYVDWTVSVATTDQGKWLSVTPSNGTTLPGVESQISVQADATTLKAGSYQGTLTFAANSLSQSVTIALTVTAPPVTTPPAAVITLQPTSLVFNTYKGSSPAAQNLKVTNSGNASLNWSPSVSSTLTNAVSISPAQGSSLQPGASVQILVTPSVAGNDVGTLSGTITVIDSDSGTTVASQTASVTISILAPPQPAISVSTKTLNFTDTGTPALQLPQQLVIQNTGAVDLHWSITESNGTSWLAIDNMSGTVTPGSSSNLRITCNRTNLPVGTYTATLTVYDSDANSSVVAQDVQVVFSVKG